MGKNTKNFRQTKSARSGSQSAQTYAKIARDNNWFYKLANFVRTRGKGDPKV